MTILRGYVRRKVKKARELFTGCWEGGGRGYSFLTFWPPRSPKTGNSRSKTDLSSLSCTKIDAPKAQNERILRAHFNEQYSAAKLSSKRRGSGRDLESSRLGQIDEELKIRDGSHKVRWENRLAHQREGMALFGGNFHEAICGCISRKEQNFAFWTCGLELNC